MVPLHWKQVHGWLSDDEAKALQTLASSRWVLEIGSYLGRSSICMAETAKGVVSVDHHLGDEGVGYTRTAGKFVANIEAAGRIGTVIPVIATSFEASKILEGKAYGLVFVDGAHDIKSVIQDTCVAQYFVAPGGVIAWHDYDRVSVREAVSKCGYEPKNVVDTLAWVQI